MAEQANDQTEPETSDKEIPQPTPQFRRRAWLDFQRALDPLAAPKPLRRPEPRLH